MEFRWNRWNVEHIDEHGITPAEAEYVVNHNGYRSIDSKKLIVKGCTESGAYIQVIFVFDPEDVVYVIHSRPLTEREKRQYRRRR